jgi:hypothetical protein
MRRDTNANFGEEKMESMKYGFPFFMVGPVKNK